MDSTASSGLQLNFGYNICSKKLSSKRGREIHEKIHSVNACASCSTCGKSCQSSTNLKNHNKVHTGEKLNSCSICEKSFAELGNMKRHMKLHRGEDSRYPQQCNLCSKWLSTKSGLQYHLTTHSEAKPFACSLCGKKVFKSCHP